MRRTHIYNKGEDETDTYIYYQIEQQYYTKTKVEDFMARVIELMLFFIYLDNKHDEHITV